MKIGIVTDTHCGARNDNDFYIRHQERFFGDIFFPTMEENKVTTIVHAGDLNDKRRAINIKSLSALNKSFIHPIVANEYDFYQILGNHDIYYKNTRTLNSVNELFWMHQGENFHIIDEPTTVSFGGGKPVFLCPWLVPDELENLNASLNTDAKVCIGHFEMAGFQMMKNVMINKGLDPDLLKQFDVILSGHYHTPSHDKNVMYIGAPYQMSYADTEDRKRFVIFDTETYALDIIYNDDLIFKQFVYNDQLIDIDQFDYDSYNDVNVKITVSGKEDVDKYNTFMQRLEKAKPFTISTIDTYVFIENNEDVADVDKDTLSIMVESVDTMDIPDARRTPVKGIFQELFHEATAT